MIRRRGCEQSREASSSEEEEDAFSALSRKSSKRQKKGANKQQQQARASGTAEATQTAGDAAKFTSSSLVALNMPGDKPEPSDADEGNGQRRMLSLTSSMKRHHKPSDLRKAKMDALLEELEAEKKRAPSKPDRFVPEKKGSFVEPSEAHLTTNIFVGNLDPSIGEEELTDLFLQFGEKKIERNVFSGRLLLRLSVPLFSCFVVCAFVSMLHWFVVKIDTNFLETPRRFIFCQNHVAKNTRREKPK